MLFGRAKTYRQPPNIKTDDLCEELLHQSHTLIGGATGSGKSVLLDTLLATLCTHSPDEMNFCVIDLKRVSVVKWRDVPHCKGYVTTPEEAYKVILQLSNIIEDRYKMLERQKKCEFEGKELYLVIDEAADLLDNPRIDKKLKTKILGELSHICRVGRAAKCHCIYCSQQVARAVIPSTIQANCSALVGLRCRSKMESRMIIGQAGCETLPRYGKGYVVTPDRYEPELVEIKMLPETTINNILHWWE